MTTTKYRAPTRVADIGSLDRSPHLLLVVEGSEADRLTLTRMLWEAAPHLRVSTAHSVGHARLSLEDRAPDWILSDYELTDGSALEVVALARTLVPEVPVLVLVDEDEEGLAAELMRRGASDHLPKFRLTPALLRYCLRATARIATATRRADDAAAAHRFLTDVGACLAGALDVSSAIDMSTKMFVDRYADACLVHILGRSGGLVRAAAAGGNLDPGSATDALIRPIQQGGWLASLLAAGRTRVIPSDHNSWGREFVSGEADLESLLKGDPMSVMCIPLVARGRSLGILTILRSGHGAYDELQRWVGESFAERVSATVDSVHRFRGIPGAVEAREHLMGTVAHHLRSPLTTIYACARRLGEADLEPEKERRQLEVLRGASERTNTMIDDLLDLAKVDAGSFALRRARESPRRLVDDVLNDLAHAAARSSVVLCTEIAPGLPQVLADRQQVSRVLLKLVGVAIEHAVGGAVTIASGRHGAFIRFSVTSAGPRMDPTWADDAFGWTWRAEQPSKGYEVRPDLAIARRIVKLHGGDIGVEGEPRGEARFWFTLPVVDSIPIDATVSLAFPADAYPCPAESSECSEGIPSPA